MHSTSRLTIYIKNQIAMSKENQITKEDVLEVANQLGFEPTEEQIQEVIDMYPSEQEADPSGTWNLVVEQCLYTLDVEQRTQSPLEKFLRKKAKAHKSDWEDVPMWVIDAANEFITKTK